MNLMKVNMLLLSVIVLGLCYLLLNEIEERAELTARIDALEQWRLGVERVNAKPPTVATQPKPRRKAT